MKTLSLLYFVRDQVLPLPDSSDKFVMKMDDDVMVDPDHFKDFLTGYMRDTPPLPDELGCRINTEGTVSRDIESKWYDGKKKLVNSEIKKDCHTKEMSSDNVNCL